MQKYAEKYYTPEEFLALEEGAKYRSEYYKGEIFAMAGASKNHNRIIGNLYLKLSASLDNSNCEVFITEIKIWIKEKDLFTYPDLVLVCGKSEFYPERNDTITNPIVIIEVLSDSTKNYDRVEKFEFYRAIPAFREYILVDQYRIHVEHFYLVDKGKWIYTDYSDMNDLLKFHNIEFQISMKDIYNRVEFKQEENTESLRPSI